MKEIVIPNSVENIESSAFKGCVSLERVNTQNSYVLEKWNSIFSDSDLLKDKEKINDSSNSNNKKRLLLVV